MDLLIEICKLSIVAAIAVTLVSACSYAFYRVTEYKFGRLADWYTRRALNDLAYVALFTLILYFSGCTPRTGLEHEYHVASITINGEVTETDFLLTKLENVK